MSNQITSLTNPRHAASSLFPTQAQRAVQRDLERTVGEALVVRAREQARGILANEVLETVGSLTALEGHLIQIAPSGEARYRAVVDTFTMGAANAIARL